MWPSVRRRPRSRVCAARWRNSAVFFAAAFAVALHPEKLTDRLGRVLCPTLIVLILVLFGACLVHPVAPHYASPAAEYQSLPALSGILNGSPAVQSRETV